MTGGESITFRNTPPAQTQARNRGGEEFVIDQLDKLELGSGGGVVTRLQDSAHLQVMSALHLGLVWRSLQ